MLQEINFHEKNIELDIDNLFYSKKYIDESKTKTELQKERLRYHLISQDRVFRKFEQRERERKDNSTNDESEVHVKKITVLPVEEIFTFSLQVERFFRVVYVGKKDLLFITNETK